MDKNNNMTKNEKIQIAYLVLISILIITLIVAIFVFVKNAELVKSEPVQYAIDNTDLDWCTCMDENKGVVVNYPRKENEIVEVENWTR